MDSGLSAIICILGIVIAICVTVYKCYKVDFASQIRLKELELEIIRENKK